MKISRKKWSELEKRVADLERQIQSQPQGATKANAHVLSEKEYPNREQWRRFEVITEDDEELAEMEKLLDRKGINRQELALILFCLRVRPGFSRKDFGI